MNDTKGKVVVCYPIVQGNGCKYFATNLAHYYKTANSDKKVALVDLDLKNPYLGSALSSHDEIHGADNLIDKIDGGFLTDDLFKENMIKLKNNVELLKGTKLVGNHKIFNKKHIDGVIAHLRSLYDFVVITVSNDADNAGTVYGLFEADEIVLVARNNWSNFKAIEKSVAIVKHYRQSQNKLKMVFNMYNEGSQVDFNAPIKEHEINVIGAVKYDEATVDNVDLNGSGLKIFKGKSKGSEIYDSIVKAFDN